MLKDARKKAGLSQAKLARLSGVPRRTIQEWERKGLDHAVVGNARKAADVLGCKIDDLL